MLAAGRKPYRRRGRCKLLQVRDIRNVRSARRRDRFDRGGKEAYFALQAI